MARKSLSQELVHPFASEILSDCTNEWKPRIFRYQLYSSDWWL